MFRKTHHVGRSSSWWGDAVFVHCGQCLLKIMVRISFNFESQSCTRGAPLYSAPAVVFFYTEYSLSGLISIVMLSYFLKGPTKHAQKSATPYITRLKMSVDFATLHVLNTFLRAALISVIFAREPSWMPT